MVNPAVHEVIPMIPGELQPLDLAAHVQNKPTTVNNKIQSFTPSPITVWNFKVSYKFEMCCISHTVDAGI